MYSTQVSREKDLKKKKKKKVVGALPTNHGYTCHDYNVSMHIIFIKIL